MMGAALKIKVQLAGLLLGPAAFFLVLTLPFSDALAFPARAVLGTSAWMAVWWITEALPIYATALLPLALFPLLAVHSAGEVSRSYMDPNIVLFMGGFFLAAALQKWQLHKRIALNILARIGNQTGRLIAGFLLATAFLSMWVSNTATALMMLPIAAAVIEDIQARGLPANSRLPSVLMLSVAYGASIGGVATLIGTPPNIVFAAQYKSLFPHLPEIGFGQWMMFGFPFAAVFLFFTWFYLAKVQKPGEVPAVVGQSPIERKLRELRPLSNGECGVGIVFILTALAWIFRVDLPLGFMTIPGWASALGIAPFVHDSTVAIAATLLLFSIPIDWRRREFLLDWKHASSIPWGILILFGGGIALAQGYQSTGLDLWIGSALTQFDQFPLFLTILFLCLGVSFLTEFTSNTATATLLLPIAGAAAVGMDIPPALLMIPAAVSASCAFMLPIATPPNAIVFGSGHLTIPRMAGAGIWLNFAGAILISAMTLLLARPVFGLQ